MKEVLLCVKGYQIVLLTAEKLVKGKVSPCSKLHCLILRNCLSYPNGTPLQYSCLENPIDRGAWYSATSLALFTFMHWRRKWQPTPMFLPGESQGRGSLVAAVCGVAQSRTRLKRLSSSSSSRLKRGYEFDFIF